jgi:diacylglycerol O-acyltransferase
MNTAPITRLHALDTEFLLMEDAASPMYIGSLCVFEGPVPSRDECERFIASRLATTPLHRKRVRTVPLSLGRPVLVDDTQFDIHYHVRRTVIAAPYAEASLWELMGTLMATPLDRHRPLWQMYIVEGLPDDRWALLTKIHHALVDGVAGIGVLAAVLSERPDVTPIDKAAWTPAPEPSGFALVANALAGLREDVETWKMELRVALQRPQETFIKARALTSGLYQYVRRFIVPKTSSLQGQVHGKRRYVGVRVQLDDARRIRDAFRCTVNDVILTLLSGGYRALLEYRGDDLSRVQLRSLVPASVRRAATDGLEGNHISAMFCELPVNIEPARARLELIAQRMKDAKASHMVEAGVWFTELVDLAPPMVVRAVSRALVRGMHWLPQNTLTTVTTNVSGPSFPLYFRGRRMLSWLPYVPIYQGARIGAAVLSYNGALEFGISADADSVQHLEIFARAIEADLATLLAAARASDATQQELVR